VVLCGCWGCDWGFVTGAREDISTFNPTAEIDGGDQVARGFVSDADGSVGCDGGELTTIRVCSSYARWVLSPRDGEWLHVCCSSDVSRTAGCLHALCTLVSHCARPRQHPRGASSAHRQIPGAGGSPARNDSMAGIDRSGPLCMFTGCTRAAL